MKYLYYPGCSMDSSAKSYQDSLVAIRDVLGIELEDIRDWNCCGASEYFSVSLLPAYALVGRNLALAARQANGNNAVVASCSACYVNLAKTEHYLREDKALNEQVNTTLSAGGLAYKPGSLQVRHLLDVVYNDVGLEAVERSVVRPLKGLRVAPYYGCLIPRPDYEHRFSSHEYPTELDKLMKALGAEVVDFPLKSHCCGGHMTQISAPVAYELIRRLVHSATEYRADVMVTLCPMCQLNLDAYQGEMNRHFRTDYHVPVLFFTQLMGLAFGKDPKALGIGREFVDARPALARIGVEVPAEESPTRKTRRPKEELPMPRMPQEP
ncbi:MAG: CoB--CoM heterodisulfide reductase iron-sulfur subunit B family protein [Anaerolineae bacterium]|nr:CoB--CoM heterodisulfide reductase iron-sulfur subunit B family protein [Anaerolineae bacterium]